MQTLRPATWLLSSLLHAALVAALLYHPASTTTSWQQGSESAAFNTETAIELELSSMLGTAAETVQATEAQEAIVAQAASDAAEEVKPVEDVVQAITSAGAADDSPVEVREPEPPQPTVEPQRIAAITEEQPMQVAREAQIAATKAQSGGDPAAIAAYGGELWGRISKNVVNPKTSRTASVRISFRVAPNGDVQELQILSNTGAKAHETATLEALKKAAPLPPLPVEWVGLHDKFSLEFRYSVR
jgi:protein TonB